MIQNSRIVRYANFFSLTVAVAATAVAWPADAFSQIVSGDAFNEPADHSILELAEEVPASKSQAGRFNSAPPTSISHTDSAFDAPAGPAARPRVKGVKPRSPYGSSLGGESTGRFTGSNPSNGSTNSSGLNQNRVSQLQPSREGNSLRPSLEPIVEDRNRDQSQPPSDSSSTSFGDQPSTTLSSSGEFSSSTTAVTSGANSTASIYGQTSEQTLDQEKESAYESAYLYDQPTQHDAWERNTPVADTFSSPSNSRELTAPVQQTASLIADNFVTEERNFVQQTAYLSPAAPAQQQFQNRNANQYNDARFGQRAQSTQQASQYQRTQQRTQQRNLPRQNQSQNQQPAQTQTADSTAAKQAIAKFSFDANQQSAEGLPVRMIDVLQQSEGRASRGQLIPQYWEVYYDWAQSVSAKHHHDWVASLNAAKQTDASSIEIAKSNAQNEITFTAIQLGKSQAKMKSLTGAAQPIVPMDSPTVTRVNTNYEAFKSRGMIAPKFEGIDSTLKQMYELIASRANTVTMAQQNADEAQQLYSRNQSTVDHVLSAGRTWRAAESDFIASVIEYNKAYADYALALPYGRGPVDAVVKMLIVKPTSNQNTSSQIANDRPNLSNNDRSNTASQTVAGGNDYSVPYGGNQSNGRNGRSAQNRQSRQSRQSPTDPRQPTAANGSVANGNAANRTAANRSGGNNGRSVANATRTQPAAQNFGNQTSAANSLISSTRPQTPSAANPQPTTGFSNAAQRSAAQPNRSPLANGGTETTRRSTAGTNLIQRPSQFPTGQPSSASSPYSSATGQSQSQNPGQSNQRSFNDQRPQTQPPAADKTAGRPNPFSPVRSADSSTSTPFGTPKPPANKPPVNAGGFNIGG